MKKTVPFEIFGANQYLSFNILDLAKLEQKTGKTIDQIIATQDVGINFALLALPIAMNQHYHNETPEFFAAKIEEHLESGGTFNDISVPLVRALLVSGILGKEVADHAMGLVTEEQKNEIATEEKPSKRSKNG